MCVSDNKDFSTKSDFWGIFHRSFHLKKLTIKTKLKMSTFQKTNTPISNRFAILAELQNDEHDDNYCIDEDFYCDEDSDIEFESQREEFINKISNDFSKIQTLYQQYCKEHNHKENPMELFAVMDILQGGSGKFICLAGITDCP